MTAPLNGINAILCSRGKSGGCRAVRIDTESGPPNVLDFSPPTESEASEASETSGEGTAVVALSERTRNAEGAHHPSSDGLASADPEPPASYWPPARVERSPNLVVIPAGTPPERCTGAKCRARKEGPATIFKVKHPTTGNMTPAAIESFITLPKDGAVVPTGAFGPYLDAGPHRESIERAGMGYSHFIDCLDAPQFKRK